MMSGKRFILGIYSRGIREKSRGITHFDYSQMSPYENADFVDEWRGNAGSSLFV